MNTWAVMPTHDEVPERALVEEVLRYVDGLVIVDDGSDETIGRAIAAQADRVGAGLVRLPVQRGKGAALRAGLDAVRDHADAVITIDADGQHPASAIPAFLIMPYTQLLPIFAKDILHTGPDGLGALMMANGIGSVIGSITVRSWLRSNSVNRLRGWSRVVGSAPARGSSPVSCAGTAPARCSAT